MVRRSARPLGWRPIAHGPTFRPIRGMASALAHGPSVPPDPWDGVRIAHGPSVPPDPWDGVRIAHGPSVPPDPWDGVRIAHGPTFRPIRGTASASLTAPRSARSVGWRPHRSRPHVPPDPWDGVRIAHGPSVPPDPWDGLELSRPKYTRRRKFVLRKLRNKSHLGCDKSAPDPPRIEGAWINWFQVCAYLVGLPLELMVIAVLLRGEVPALSLHFHLCRGRSPDHRYRDSVRNRVRFANSARPRSSIALLFWINERIMQVLVFLLVISLVYEATEHLRSAPHVAHRDSLRHRAVRGDFVAVLTCTTRTLPREASDT